MRLNAYHVLGLGLVALAIMACDSTTSSASASSSTFDTRLEGSWIEVKGMQGPDARDTFTFSAAKIDLGTISNLPHYAVDGQIWEKFDTEKNYKYVYELVGDTLWLDAYDYQEESTPKVMNRMWANAFVKMEKYTVAPLVDLSLVGLWVETDAGYNDSLVFSATQFEFHHARRDLFVPTVYGDSGAQVFVQDGQIGEIVNGVRDPSYSYRLVGDTLLLDPCNTSWCSQFAPDFTPGQTYVKR